MPQNIFDFHFEFAEIFEFEKWFLGLSYPAGQKIIFKMEFKKDFKMDTISLG
jgi:hypothetical protein